MGQDSEKNKHRYSGKIKRSISEESLVDDENMKVSAKKLHLDLQSTSDNSNDDDDISEEPTACCICGSDHSPKNNVLVLCDGEGCDIPVHQSTI